MNGPGFQLRKRGIRLEDQSEDQFYFGQPAV